MGVSDKHSPGRTHHNSPPLPCTCRTGGDPWGRGPLGKGEPLGRSPGSAAAIQGADSHRASSLLPARPQLPALLAWTSPCPGSCSSPTLFNFGLGLSLLIACSQVSCLARRWKCCFTQWARYCKYVWEERFPVLIFILSIIYLGAAVERRTMALFLFNLTGEVRNFVCTILITGLLSASRKLAYSFPGAIFSYALKRPHFPYQGARPPIFLRTWNIHCLKLEIMSQTFFWGRRLEAFWGP